MSDINYPKIPIKNWWALRKKFKKTKPARITDNSLATILNIEVRTAQNVLPGLRTIGFIDDDGNCTELVNRWRVDDEYSKVCEEIKNKVYPEELLTTISDPENEFEAAVQWFMRDASVGEPTAKQMALFYQLILKADPSEAMLIEDSKKRKKIRKSEIKSKRDDSKPTKTRLEKADDSYEDAPSLHIDIQIHVSPDTTPDQIEKIFECMSKYIYKFKK